MKTIQELLNEKQLIEQELKRRLEKKYGMFSLIYKPEEDVFKFYIKDSLWFSIYKKNLNDLKELINLVE